MPTCLGHADGGLVANGRTQAADVFCQHEEHCFLRQDLPINEIAYLARHVLESERHLGFQTGSLASGGIWDVERMGVGSLKVVELGGEKWNLQISFPRFRESEDVDSVKKSFTKMSTTETEDCSKMPTTEMSALRRVSLAQASFMIDTWGLIGRFVCELSLAVFTSRWILHVATRGSCGLLFDFARATVLRADRNAIALVILIAREALNHSSFSKRFIGDGNV